MSRTLWAALLATLVASAWLALQADEPEIEVVAARLPAPLPSPTTSPNARQRDDAPAWPTTRPAAPQPAGRPAVPPAPPLARMPAWPSPPPAALAAWTAPPPPLPPRASEPSAASAPRPRAPAFPYRWIGRLDDGAQAHALLADATRSFGVRAGDNVGTQWRVERVGHGGIVVTWLPEGQTVNVGAP
jgi:hypothetical protein